MLSRNKEKGIEICKFSASTVIGDGVSDMFKMIRLSSCNLQPLYLKNPDRMIESLMRMSLSIMLCKIIDLLHRQVLKFY